MSQIGHPPTTPPEAGIDLTGLVFPAMIIPDLRVASKSKALTQIACRAAELTGRKAEPIYRALIEREHLGSTGIGQGLAIPHARLEGLDQPCLLVSRLSVPIDFEAVDEEPVDLIALLLSPLEDNILHLRTLSRLCRLLHNAELCRALRRPQNAEAMSRLLADAVGR